MEPLKISLQDLKDFEDAKNLPEIAPLLDRGLEMKRIKDDMYRKLDEAGISLQDLDSRDFEKVEKLLGFNQ